MFPYNAREPGKTFRARIPLNSPRPRAVATFTSHNPNIAWRDEYVPERRATVIPESARQRKARQQRLNARPRDMKIPRFDSGRRAESGYAGHDYFNSQHDMCVGEYYDGPIVVNARLLRLLVDTQEPKPTSDPAQVNRIKTGVLDKLKLEARKMKYERQMMNDARR